MSRGGAECKSLRFAFNGQAIFYMSVRRNRYPVTGSWEDAAKAVSSKVPSQRPFAEGRDGTWVDAASTPLSPTKSAGRESPRKPFAAGSTPSWLEAASKPMWALPRPPSSLHQLPGAALAQHQFKAHSHEQVLSDDNQSGRDKGRKLGRRKPHHSGKQSIGARSSADMTICCLVLAK